MKVKCVHCAGRGQYNKCDVCGVEYSYVMDLPQDLKPLLASGIDLCTSCMDTLARARAEAIKKTTEEEDFTRQPITNKEVDELLGRGLP